MTVEVVRGEIMEYGSLAENEQIIEAHLTSFVEVGRALARIREDGQYVMVGCETFEDYCRERWDMALRTAEQYMAASRVVGVLTRARARVEPPQFESHARPLAKVLNEQGEDAVVEAWSRVVESHDGDGPITSREVNRFLKLGGTGANYGKPGWRELLGEIGDTLVRANKQMEKLEGAVHRTPNADFRAKAGEYGDLADGLAQRLREIGEPA